MTGGEICIRPAAALRSSLIESWDVVVGVYCFILCFIGNRSGVAVDEAVPVGCGGGRFCFDLAAFGRYTVVFLQSCQQMKALRGAYWGELTLYSAKASFQEVRRSESSQVSSCGRAVSAILLSFL